jgi:hypothetical protein
MPTRLGDSSKQYHELHAVECQSGKLIAHIRNENRQNHLELLQSESIDGGKNWTEPHLIGVWGLPSHLLRLQDARLLLTYGYRRPPYGIQAQISSDEGTSWSDPMTISSDGNSPDLGYPSTAACLNGDFITVWYELLKGSELAQLRQARWRIN